ncbi:MAG: GHMP kinase, partial [bacterium]|nr:GHMP kinase [bacterium]
AFGGVNYIRFNRDETVDVAPILLTEPALRDIERNLRLYYIGGEHKAGDILKQQKRNLSEDRKKFDHMVKMLNLANELNDEMNSQQVNAIGTKLHQGWTFKKQLARGISNRTIDELYEKAMAGGAAGGKLLGAGGAGFLLLWHVDHERLSQQLGRKTLPLKIDREGSKIIFYE